MDKYLAVADPSNVHPLSAGMRRDEKRRDFRLVVLAEYRRRDVEFRPFFRGETLVAAAVTLLELFEKMNTLFLEMPDVRRREQQRRWGRWLDARYDALDSVASRRRW